jgi:hypothetical protein
MSTAQGEEDEQQPEASGGWADGDPDDTGEEKGVEEEDSN